MVTERTEKSEVHFILDSGHIHWGFLFPIKIWAAKRVPEYTSKDKMKPISNNKKFNVREMVYN